MPGSRRTGAAALLLVAVVACNAGAPQSLAPPNSAPIPTAAPSPFLGPTATPPPDATQPPPSPAVPIATIPAPPDDQAADVVSATPPPSSQPVITPPVVDIPIRFAARADDPASATFPAIAAAVLTDPRGWQQAGFRFLLSEDAPYTVLLAEPDEVDAACHPYDTGGRFSCQLGPVVALNADRWRGATETWTASLDDYRTMLVNHEVGHLLGQHHPGAKCEPPDTSASVMSQQSTGLDGCLPNPWPLPWEIACAALHEEPIAPGYEPSAAPLCGPAGRILE